MGSKPAAFNAGDELPEKANNRLELVQTCIEAAGEKGLEATAEAQIELRASLKGVIINFFRNGFSK